MELIWGVLRLKKYASIAAVTAVFLGTLYYFLTMAMLPDHIEIASKDYGWYIMTSIGLGAAVSVLGGINVSLIIFKTLRMRRMNSAKQGGTAVLGGAFSMFTPGCPACTAPLAVVLGAAGGLSVLPMFGLELKIISAGVLIFSTYWIARGLQRQSCCSI